MTAEAFQSPQQTWIAVETAAKSMNVNRKTILALLEQAGHSPFKNRSRKLMMLHEHYTSIKQHWLSQEKPATGEQDISALKAAIHANVRVQVRDRDGAPEALTLYTGPTNSGKTYHALQALLAAYEDNPSGKHVYGGPLRLLAYEVYEKLAARIGAENVGFITGEESINPEAPVLACTSEMVPAEGDTLLLDEAHWLADPERGHIWARSLTGAAYKNLHVISAAEAKDMIVRLAADAKSIQINNYERLNPLQYGGSLTLEQIPKKSAVVAFSRKNVYAVAGELTRRGKKVGVLYGALPLPVRKKQIEAFIDGKTDIIVTTDVIGHGINLPVDHIVFAQTQKYDGKQMRELHIWEGAQIAGRAGRFQLSDQGKAWTLIGSNIFIDPAEEYLVQTYVAAANGAIRTDLDIPAAPVVPRLRDLGLNPAGGLQEAAKLLPALEAWQMVAQERLPSRDLIPAELMLLKENAATIIEALGGTFTPWHHKTNALYSAEKYPASNITVETIWQLASGPFSPENRTLAAAARWAADLQQPSAALQRFYQPYQRDALRLMRQSQTEQQEQLVKLEEIAAINAELRMLYVMFGEEKQLGTLHQSNVEEVDTCLEKMFTSILSNPGSSSGRHATKCKHCNKNTVEKAWHAYCNACYTK